MKAATQNETPTTDVVTPLVTDVPATDQNEDTSVQESTALDSLNMAATDGAPVLQSDVDALCQRIRRNRLASKAGKSQSIARYLVAPNRKSLGL